MLKPMDRGSTLIAAQQLRFSGRTYRPGDKFDYSRMGIQHRRTVENMMRTRKVTELTAESMKTALRFREENAGPPRGFTLAGLKGLGILTEEQIAERGWGARDQDAEVTDESAETPAWQAPEGSFKVSLAEGDGADAVYVVPFRNGNRGAFRYFVHDLNGENLNGAGSIAGKDNAEAWARDYLTKRAESASAERNGDPDWSAFPENEDDWTDEQVAEFDAWYDALQPGAEVSVEHAAVTKLVEERRTAEKAEQDLQAGRADGLSTEEANALLDAMTEDELREHVATVTGKSPDLLKELTPLALREMAVKAGMGENDGGNVQPGAGD